VERTQEDEKLIEEAIKFLVRSIAESRKNPKPVMLHSMRVAMYLENLGYSRDIVIGAILHDILEDTAAPPEAIREKFGDNVAKLVEANSFDEGISDKAEQYKELFLRCKNAGKDATVIKAADILDNSNYYDSNQHLLEKMRYFIEFSKEDLGGEPVWETLKEQATRLAASL
jgi:(p)ppGpp synthase/HD superfamily hydrolase